MALGRRCRWLLLHGHSESLVGINPNDTIHDVMCTSMGRRGESEKGWVPVEVAGYIPEEGRSRLLRVIVDVVWREEEEEEMEEEEERMNGGRERDIESGLK